MMIKFPVDAPVARVRRSLETLGFRIVREGNHIAMVRENARHTHAIDYAEPPAPQILDSANHPDASRYLARRFSSRLRSDVAQRAHLSTQQRAQRFESAVSN